MYPKAGYAADYWDDGANQSSDNPMTVTVSDGMALEAVFGEAPFLQVSFDPTHGEKIEGRLVSNNQLIINCGDGNDDCSEAVDSGTEVRLTAVPVDGCSLVHWDDGDTQYIGSINNGYPLVVIVGDYHINVEVVFREGFRNAVRDFRKQDGDDGGQCVQYVRSETDIPWSACNGLAYTCFSKATQAGFSTGSTPQVGAIIVFNAASGDLSSGHVGVVKSIDGSNVTIQDSNWHLDEKIDGENVINVNNYGILGYIYPVP